MLNDTFNGAICAAYNEKIAKFLGWEKEEKILEEQGSHGNHDKWYKDCHKVCDFELKFHYNWAALMAVVLEIEKLDYGVKICRHVVEIYRDSTKENIIRAKEKSKFTSIYYAVCQFVLWLELNIKVEPIAIDEPILCKLCGTNTVGKEGDLCTVCGRQSKIEE